MKRKKKLPLDERFFRAYAQLERLLNLRLDDLTTNDVERFHDLHISLSDYYEKQLRRR